MVNDRKKSTRALATGGIFLALSIVTLFIATIIPGVELTLYAISSFYVAFIIVESGARNGMLFYVASVLLGLLIVPNKAGLLPYAMFFGLYGIVKYYIEKIRKTPFEIVLKLLFFNVSYGVGLLFFKELFLGSVNLPDLAWPLLIIGAQGFFLFFDYLYTLVVGFYLAKRPSL